MSDQEFSIQDLCDQTGLPRRTIHFYIQQEILPPALGAGLGARYQSAHLLRLQLIPILRNQGLRLDDIREKFSANTDTELSDLLSSAISSAPPVHSPAEKVPLPVISFTPKRFQAYSLPHGLILLAPQPLSTEIQNQVDHLLNIFLSEFNAS